MRRLFLFFALFALATATKAQEAVPVSIALGELALEGKIIRIQTAQLTIEVTAFRNANNKRGPVNPPKIKTIVWPRSKLSAKVGDEVLVVGSDGGTGQPMVARQITLLHPPKPPDSAPKPPIEPEASLLLTPGAPPLKVGDLTIHIEKTGFEEFTRLVSNYSPLSHVPMFYAIFSVEGAAKDQPVASRFVFRPEAAKRFSIKNSKVPLAHSTACFRYDIATMTS